MGMVHPEMTPWHINEFDFPASGSLREKLRFLVGYSVLAPSPRNTQPWKFAVSDAHIRLYVDRRRWQRIADDDQRELYISAGCALENLLIAAGHFGYRATVNYCPRPVSGPDPANLELAADVFLEQDATRAVNQPALFHAITERQTDRGAYERTIILHEVLEQMESCFTEEGIHLHFITDAETRRRLDDLVRRADAIEFEDPAFRRELGGLIGQGAFSTSWLVSALGQIVVSHLSRGGQAVRQDHALMTSAPMLGILSSERDDRASQVRVGQVLERLWLTATAYGVHLHPMSQMLEVPGIRTQLTGLLALPDLVPQQPFLLGRVEAAPRRHTPRRPVSEFLIESERARSTAIR